MEIGTSVFSEAVEQKVHSKCRIAIEAYRRAIFVGQHSKSLNKLVRSRILHPDLTYNFKRSFDLGFRRTCYCIPNLPKGSFDSIFLKKRRQNSDH